MWFNRQKQSSSNSLNNGAAQSLLSSLYSNGIDLSMQELLQYQSKSRLIDLAGKKNIRGKQSGNYLSRSKGRGMEFDEVRHYQTGDDVRAVDHDHGRRRLCHRRDPGDDDHGKVE